MRRLFRCKHIMSFFMSALLSVLALGSLQMCTQVSDLLKETEAGIPSLSNLIEEKPAITTDLSDAVTEVPFLDDFNRRMLLPSPASTEVHTMVLFSTARESSSLDAKATVCMQEAMPREKAMVISMHRSKVHGQK